MLKHYVARFWARNWTTYRVLFSYTPYIKKNSLSEGTRTVTLLPRPSNHLNKSLTRLKSNLCWNTILRVFEREIWQPIQSFFLVYCLRQNLNSSQTVLKQWHSSLDPQFIWISPWLGWKAIYVEPLYSESLSAKFDNVSITFSYTP